MADGEFVPLPGASHSLPQGAWVQAPAQVQPRPDDTFSIISLALGIMAWVLHIRFFTSIAAIIVGVISLRKIRDDPSRYGGRGMAQAGIALGAADVILITAIVVIYLLIILVPLLIAFVAALVQGGAV